MFCSFIKTELDQKLWYLNNYQAHPLLAIPIQMEFQVIEPFLIPQITRYGFDQSYAISTD